MCLSALAFVLLFCCLLIEPLLSFHAACSVFSSTAVSATLQPPSPPSPRQLDVSQSRVDGGLSIKFVFWLTDWSYVFSVRHQSVWFSAVVWLDFRAWWTDWGCGGLRVKQELKCCLRERCWFQRTVTSPDAKTDKVYLNNKQQLDMTGPKSCWW